MTEFDPAKAFGPEVAAQYDDEPRGDEADGAAFLAALAGAGSASAGAGTASAGAGTALAGAGTALEFAIGTGRMALPLGGHGVRVDGIELSPAMVEQLRTRPGGAALDVTIGDMSRVELGRRYPLVYLVFNTIFNLLTADDQIRCFENAARHLTDDGVFVVETAIPSAWVKPDRHDYVGVENVGVSDVSLDVCRYDPVTQLLEENHVRISTTGITMGPIT